MAVQWPPLVTPATARELVRRLIDTGVPEVGGRVFESDMPPAGTATPFIVLRFGNDSLISSWGARATPVYVWAFVGEQDAVASYRLVDDLNSKVVAALTPGGEAAWIDEATALGQPVAAQPGLLGNRYLVEYVGVAIQDTRDETLQAIARPTEFNLSATNFRAQDHAVLVEISQAIVAALPGVQTDPAVASPTAASPLIYLRFDQPPIASEQLTLESWWMEAHVAVHVITPDPVSRVDRLVDLANAMVPNTTEGWHVVHDSLGKNPIQMGIVRGSASADAFQEGQLTLRVRYIEVDTSDWPAAVPVDHVTLSTPVKGKAPIP